jgi:hypothetical protein
LKGNALSRDGFWTFLGQQSAPSWDQGASAIEVALGAAINMVSAGCKLHSSSGTESQAEVVLTGWPSGESLENFGLTQEEADSVFGVFGPIAESLGYSYEWQRQGDQVTMTFSR